MKKDKVNFNRTALVSALMLATGTQAETINVDGVTCNLDDAVQSANTDTATGGCTAGSGADILELPIAGTINTDATLAITSEITINGNGSIVQPDPGLQNPHRLIDGSTAIININDLHLQNGNGFIVGGISLTSNSTLNLNNSSVSNIVGGGIVFVQSSGTVNDSVIRSTGNGNGAYYGSALTVASSTVVISNSTFTGNNNKDTETGGTISVNGYSGGSNLTISNTTISGNTSFISGGGIGVTSYGNYSSITLENVTITSNTTSNVGGGIFNDGSDFVIKQSIISGNYGLPGREINSTGGVIIANNFNIFGLNDDASVLGVTVGPSDIVPSVAALTDIVDVNLLDNGGPTPTHALAVNSPALDAIPAASCSLLTDQTGKDRPIDGNVDGTADCDIGAYENPNPDIIFENGFD